MLSARRVETVKDAGKYADGGGLYLVVTRSGSKNWMHRATVNGKRSELGLGGYPDVSLAQARERCADNRKLIMAGVDPRERKREMTPTACQCNHDTAPTPDTTPTDTDGPTLREATAAYFDLHSVNLRNGKHRSNWLQVLERHAFPTLGDRPVSEITGPDVLAVLTPIWTSRPPTAKRVRQRLRTILAWAVANGHASINAAGEIIDGGLPKQAPRNEHFRAAPYADVPDILRTVDASTANESAKLAFRFMVLTAARPCEALGASWGEIDLDARVWEIPAERMKAGVTHKVPLSDAALETLDRARGLDDGSGAIFPSPMRKRRTLSDMAFTQLLRRVGLSDKTTAHGMRTCFAVWGQEQTRFTTDEIDLALAHTIGSAVTRAYARSDMFERRRPLMDAWGLYVTQAA